MNESINSNFLSTTKLFNKEEFNKAVDQVIKRNTKTMNKASITYDEFLKNVNTNILYKPTYMRKGQALMNYLYIVWPDGYEKVTGERTIDCFYNDNLIHNTLNFLKKNWQY